MTGFVSADARRRNHPEHARRLLHLYLASLGVLLVIALCTWLAIAPAVAAAETCTNTWTGPETGNWGEAADWSAGHAPTSTDVACIAAATVEVTEGANHAGTLDGEGAVELEGGSLELNATSTTSTISALLVDSGELKIVSGAKATGKFLETARRAPHSGSVSVGENTELDYQEIIMYGGSISLGNKTQLTGVSYLSVEAGAKFQTGAGSTISTNELYAEGTFIAAGTVETHFLRSEAGTIAGGASIVTDEVFLGAGSPTTLDESQLVVQDFGRIDGTLAMANGALLENDGEMYVANDTGEYIIHVPTSSTATPKIVNVGEFVHSELGTATIAVPFEDFGQIIEYKTQFVFLAPIEEGSPEWNEEDEAELCGEEESVGCGTGNFSHTEGDFTIGGRGVGLNLTRSYNSQAAVSGAHGVFGYGWSSSFSDHLLFEPTQKRVTLAQADGSTVGFAEGAGGALSAPPFSQDTLTGTPATGYTLTKPDQTIYKFAGTTGRLQSVTDRNGNATTVTYNGGGAPEAITDPAGRKITFAYNGEGLVESAKDPMGHVVKYTYEAGNLATVTQPGETGLRWQLKYDGAHQMTEVTDGRGGKSLNEYNSLHQIVAQTDAMKRLTTYEYKPFHTITTNHATGAITSEVLTSGGEATEVTRGYGTPSATTEARSYDRAHNLVNSTDGDGHTTKYIYDAHANRTSMVDALGDESKWTYDATHDVETETKPNGEISTYKRDAHGNPEVIERPAPGGATQTTKYTYDSHGSATSMEDSLKRLWKYEYDAAGDRTGEIDPEGDKRKWGYNEDSQETTTVSPRGVAAGGAKEAKYKTTTERDAQGRVTLVIAPLKHETKYTYDADGNRETETDPELNKTTYVYDADNERTKVEEPNKTVTEVGYDGAGRVTSQTDGNKHTTKYVRNPLEQVAEVIDPLGRKTTDEYDASGNLTRRTDAAKRTTTYKYDAANRRTEVSYSDGKTPKVEYEYDADGNRTKMVDGTGTSEYTYDQLDRLTEAKDGHGDVSAYEYDLADEQTKITYPNGKAVVRAYDNDGRLKSVTDWLEHTSKFAYDADSDQTATTFPATTTNEDTYVYDEADLINEVKMAKGTETLASLVYTRNKDGGVTKATTTGLPGEEKPGFGYDENNRLTKGAGIVYKYDAANNPTLIGGERTYSYDAANELERNLLKKAIVSTYAYDELGERTKTTPASGPATTYGYDQAGNLTSIARAHEGEIAAIEDSYGYNGDGLRASQAISGTTTYMAWNATEKLPLLLSDGTTNYVYGPGGLPVEQIATAGAVLYVHHDQQGSTRMLTGASGESVGTTTYDGYGNVLGRTGTSTSSLGYDGQYADGDTGLIYLRARDYDPATGQFVTTDPAGSGSESLYTYGNDDPTNDADPTGERAKKTSYKVVRYFKVPRQRGRRGYTALRQGLAGSWGQRHIEAKHGDESPASRIEEALEHPTGIQDAGGGTFVYLRHEVWTEFVSFPGEPVPLPIPREGVFRVVVNRTILNDGDEKGIITAYLERYPFSGQPPRATEATR